MEFETNFKRLDGRSTFANRVLKLIYQKHNGNIDAAIIEAEPFFVDFKEYVRNIYELISTQIPLYRYYELLRDGAENYGYSEAEYEEKIEDARKACELYYK